MKKVSILHLLAPAKNASPFDVNMAFDAGFDNIMPYTNVALNEVTGLVQDAIFSRSPSGVKLEGIFIGGRDIDLAMDMLDAAKKAMFAPFECSLFADPSGAFTTAAAMVAKVENQLKKHFKTNLAGKKIAIFGATGPVGGCAAVIAAKQGAEVLMVSHKSLADVNQKVQSYNQRYGIVLNSVDGATDNSKQAVLAQVDVALCCAAAGVRVLNAQQIAKAKSLKIIADVNAVAPTGAEGVEAVADGVAIGSTKVIGIGALAIGNLKYATQHNLLAQMLTTDKPSYLEFMAAFAMAQSLASGK
ncbi:MAG TPA: methylenetetrahydromethanopterin dehydrogenase [Methylotenera sp.]|nr:methylenetetrahydromethanopterin dehydrogenase [Methylotenera sp.]HPH04845.1 methylenetetrahydromethanopterin dehydrogenase [Methylotenera sp.]HPN02227.1 methylenetetrahydromethanopterin dehydrogenase [Methylotenera sp.]